MRREYWVTKDGERVAISEMDDRHLLNAAQMMSRNLERAVSRMMTLAAAPTELTGDPEDDPDELRQRVAWCKQKLDMLDAEALRRWSL